MTNWRLFGKLKNDEIKESDEKIEEKVNKAVREELEEKPLAEYKETLYSSDSAAKKGSSMKQKTSALSDQRIWRDVKSIEENIGNIHIIQAKKPVTEVNKKVDRLISKTESNKTQIHRKPVNVIYIVSKPQPGQVQGDWAVRGHRKIYSHHRKKVTAIKTARKIAKERNATVLIQNTDGTFSKGFKPRRKK